MVVGIVGTGLIGGSIGMSLKTKGHTVIGWDLNAQNLETATRRFAIDSPASFEETCQADLVFVSVPPADTIPVCEGIHRNRGPQTVVTDTCSVKTEICDWSSQFDYFVPAHPMAGHEKGGPEFASSWLFRSAKWVICPSKITSTHALQLVQSAVKEMGATTVKVSPKDHDRSVGVQSHLPHILAGLLLQMAKDQADVSGGSFKDLTRVAGVDPYLWTQILLANRSEMDVVLEELVQHLDQIRKYLHQADHHEINRWLTQVAEWKEKSSDEKSQTSTKSGRSGAKRSVKS